MTPVTITYNGYLITTDKSFMHIPDVHKWLSEVSYWSKHIPFDLFNTAFNNSYCIAAIKGNAQVAFGRLVTDYATFAYLADVFVKEEHRGNGIGKKMMEVLFELDWVKKLRAIKLATKDAHGLYAQFGFTDCRYPERMMEITRPSLYEQLSDNINI